MRRTLLLLLIVTAALYGCGTSFVAANRTVRQGPVSFRVGVLRKGWTRVLDSERVAFHHEGGGTISASVSCSGGGDAPLDVLTEHLLFGIEPRRIVSRNSLTLDGRAALDSRIEGRLDGVPVLAELIVVKKDGCVFDLQLVGTPITVAQRNTDFTDFWRGFRLVVSR